MYASECRVQRKVCRFAAQTKAAPLRRLAPARLGRPSRARCVATPPTEKHPARCLRHSRIGGRLPTRVCLRRVGPASLLPPPASPAPSALPAATAMASAHEPSLSTARRRRTHCRPCRSRRAEAPLRDACAGACWHPREATRSAPPLRRGAAARQFPPSLCRCAHQPLTRHSSHSWWGFAPPIPPRGPKAPFCWPYGPEWRLRLQTSAALRRRASGWSLKGIPGIAPHSLATSRARTAEHPQRSRPFPTQSLGIPLIQTSANTLKPNTFHRAGHGKVSQQQGAE